MVFHATRETEHTEIALVSIRKCSRRPTTGGSRQAVPEIESDKRSISHFGPSLTFQQTLPSGREQLKRMIKPANLFTSNVYNLLEVLAVAVILVSL